jgi:hypothetical protein
VKSGWLLLLILFVAGCGSDLRQQRAIAALRAGGATVQIDVRGDALSVDLRHCSLTEPVRRALTELPHLKTLAVGKDFGDDDVSLLSGLTTLENLDLSYSGASGVTLAALKGLAGLRFVSLNGLALTDADVGRLAELRSLTSLSLIEARISDRGLEELRTANSHCLIVR